MIQASPGPPRARTVCSASATSDGVSSGNATELNSSFAPPSSNVSTKPGHSAETVMPSPASALPAARAYPTTACLVSVYSGSAGIAVSPASDAVITILPPQRRNGGAEPVHDVVDVDADQFAVARDVQDVHS